ncbi:hotdog fold thioesterase [Gammaproteobacteria bacterium]|jgi:1,4-dihydroxy-2-naphthoyl-CoA hydrolase|nr:hotdog fold thioesterase [Gammaproteobacteria bacterium]MDA9268672.1 hotdog fold thioesterase [Gammaproteobacteria bacterium]MDA9782231.1 hotdog fold thioesterase [Gammaproteobacteria bacterium]MDA9784922.1 hotdog fold thioesterase [Gammaproteobacteria bacterium]MDA9835004.1 hotdog fold thioesterase [Gammaproteobacteria bacterium]|tara:strand:+ start:147 stop:578 length:432 start_codon:yes stop_codon:yes gene_type:complete
MKNTIWFKPLSIEDLKDSAVNMDKNLGIEFTEIGDDYIIARMPVIEKTKQPYGILHGGASCVLAESLGSTAAALSMDGEKKYPVGIEINANHLSSPTEGFVYAKAMPVHIGGSTSVWNIDITDDAGKRVCYSRFTAMHKSYPA